MTITISNWTVQVETTDTISSLGPFKFVEINNRNVFEQEPYSCRNVSCARAVLTFHAQLCCDNGESEIPDCTLRSSETILLTSA